MSIPPLPGLSAIDAAFVDLVLAFLVQVFHMSPVHDSIRHMEITETVGSMTISL